MHVRMYVFFSLADTYIPSSLLLIFPISPLHSFLLIVTPPIVTPPQHITIKTCPYTRSHIINRDTASLHHTQTYHTVHSHIHDLTHLTTHTHASHPSPASPRSHLSSLYKSHHHNTTCNTSPYHATISHHTSHTCIPAFASSTTLHDTQPHQNIPRIIIAQNHITPQHKTTSHHNTKPHHSTIHQSSTEQHTTSIHTSIDPFPACMACSTHPYTLSHTQGQAPSFCGSPHLHYVPFFLFLSPGHFLSSISPGSIVKV